MLQSKQMDPTPTKSCQNSLWKKNHWAVILTLFEAPFKDDRLQLIDTPLKRSSFFFFFNITRLFAMGLYFLKWNFQIHPAMKNAATIFQAWSCKICHILHNFLYTTGIRIGTLITIQSLSRDEKKGKSSFDFRPEKTSGSPKLELTTFAFSQLHSHATSTSDSSGHVLPASSAPWYSGWLVGMVQTSRG